MMINPVAKDGTIDPPAKMMITMTWDDQSSTDIDLWVKGPSDAKVGYHSKDSGYMVLARDDLGTTNDTMEIDGKTVIVYRNYEVVELTLLPTGEYVVNIHHFSATFEEPVDVTIEITMLDNHKTVYKGITTLVAPKQELTAISFMVDDAGKIADIRTDVQIPVKTVSQHYP